MHSGSAGEHLLYLGETNEQGSMMCLFFRGFKIEGDTSDLKKNLFFSFALVFCFSSYVDFCPSPC